MNKVLTELELKNKVIEVATTLGIKPYFIEKDYYLTLILSQIDKLSSNLVELL